jgi:hypothetical protein
VNASARPADGEGAGAGVVGVLADGFVGRLGKGVGEGLVGRLGERLGVRPAQRRCDSPGDVLAEGADDAVGDPPADIESAADAPASVVEPPATDTATGTATTARSTAQPRGRACLT